MTCPSCGAATDAGARFCPSCGHQLRGRGDERRIATVLFADLVGFTALSETRDPEQVKELVDRCFERLAGVITSFGGKVDKIIGDAILALFGAPVAHEDDPERAVRAALRMQEAIAAFADDQGAPVRLRVGVNTGEVLVGSLRAGGEYTAMGDVVNTANRLQAVAEPGTVVVGPDTHAATAEVIEFRSLGPVDARGREEPVDAWMAIEPLLPPGHRRRSRQTPFVGRHNELVLLTSAAQAAITHRRLHLVVLAGEAGVGKSRLAEEAAADAAGCLDATVLEGRCVPYGEANVWFPVAEALRQACDITPDDDLDQAAAKARASVAAAVEADEQSPEVKRIVTGALYLMGYEVSLRDIDPQRAREEAARSVLAFIEGSARQRPLVVVLSDLHWADDLVLGLVDALVERLSRSPVVVIATARSSLLDRWTPPTGRHNTLALNLDPLDRDSTSLLLSALLESAPGDGPESGDGSAARPADSFREALLDRSGGNPFFLEELVSLVVSDRGGAAVLASPVATTATLPHLPDTLRGLVAARVDALEADERAILEDASVWGRSGPLKALSTMASSIHDIHQIDRAVQHLVGADVLVVTGDRWRFRNDVVREVAYSMLTKADRARRHHGIAKYLELTARPDAPKADRLVDVVAYHYGAAAELVAELGEVEGVPPDVGEQAVTWLQQAAERAEITQALPVAARLFRQAVELVGDEESARRVRLLIGLAGAEAEQRRLDDADDLLDRAAELAARLGEENLLARTLLVRGDLRQKGGDLDAALTTLQRATDRFNELGDVKGQADAQRLLGITLLFHGDLASAEQVIDASLRGSRQLGDRRGEAWALQNLAWIAYLEGHTGQAEQRLEASAATFVELDDPGGLAWAHGLLAFVRFHQGRFEEASQLGEDVLIEARERGDRWGEGMMLLLLASVRQWSGHTRAAVAAEQDALATFRAIGDRYGEIQSLAALGRSVLCTGQVDQGIGLLAEARDAALDQGQADFAALLGGALAGAAVQAGEPGRGLPADPTPPVSSSEPATEVSLGADEALAAAALAQLQLGDVGAAMGTLSRSSAGEARGSGPHGEVPEVSAYARSVVALARAASGEVDDAVSIADELAAAHRVTYLDITYAGVAAVLGRASRGEDITGELSALMARVAATEDRVAQAIVARARAVALERDPSVSSDVASAAVDDADDRWFALGVEGEGWSRLFRLIVRARRPRPTLPV